MIDNKKEQTTLLLSGCALKGFGEGSVHIGRLDCVEVGVQLKRKRPRFDQRQGLACQVYNVGVDCISRASSWTGSRFRTTLIIYIANDLVATAIIHYRAYSIGGGSQKTSSNSAIIDPDLDIITTDLRRIRRYSATNLRENQPRPIGCQLAEWEFFLSIMLANIVIVARSRFTSLLPRRDTSVMLKQA